MKYLSLILVAAFLMMTWWFAQQQSSLSVSQKNKITSLIRQYMTQAVKSKDPTITNIEFSTIYTEDIEPGRKMRAHFQFSYMQPVGGKAPSKVHRKGTFTIASNDGDIWRAQVEQIKDVEVEFMEPQGIIGDMNNPVTDEVEPSTNSEPKDPEH